jgi:C1A family cysteine protease
MQTSPVRRSRMTFSTFTGPSLAIGAFGLCLSLAACGEPAEEEVAPPVAADQIDGNDAPLAVASELKRDFPGDENIAFEGKADVVLPTSFDILSLQTPIRNQSRRGVCSIFSTMGLVESLYKKAGLATPDFSEQYLQWSVKVQLGRFANTEGSSDNYNLEAVVKHGVPIESAWPYNPNPWTTVDNPACTGETQPTTCYTQGDPPAAAKSAPKYKLPASRWVSTSSIKNVIYEKRTGVLAGLDFFYQAWNHRLSTLPVNSTYFSKGYVLSPNSTDVTESRKKPAGHSIQLVGWDDNLEIQKVDKDGKLMVDSAGKPIKEKGFFLFKNSWGTDRFGVTNAKGAGYGWIGYSYIRSYASCNTADQPTRTTP